jgi:serine/threonine protein kinase
MHKDIDTAIQDALKGRYYLEEQLALSGLSVVFKAHDRASGKTIAVKVTRCDFSGRTIREQEIMQQLNSIRGIAHPNILPVHDVGCVLGVFYVTMPLLDGPSLRDLLEQNLSFSVSETCEIVAQICRGLAAAHRNGLSHGYFRPSSVFVSQTDRNEYRVLIGGFERAVFRDALMNGENIAIGTPSPYDPPELLIGGYASLQGAQSDLWSIGMLAYECINGGLPHRAIAGDLLFSRMRDELPLEFNANTPIELRDLVTRLLRVDPSKRPDSADAVALELELIRRSHSEILDWSYDVAISFAGEDRLLAKNLAEALRRRNIRVFFDEHLAAEIWGKNLSDYLPEVYRSTARFCIVLVSRHYSAKAWPNHERRAILDRAIREFDRDYILPIKLDATSLPGLPDSTAYLNASIGVDVICDLLVEKLHGAHSHRWPAVKATRRRTSGIGRIGDFLQNVGSWFQHKRS